MRAFDCPYLVKFIGVAVEDDCVMLVTEFMNGGDLFQGLHGPRRADFAWNAMCVGLVVLTTVVECCTHACRLAMHALQMLITLYYVLTMLDRRSTGVGVWRSTLQGVWSICIATTSFTWWVARMQL